MYLALVGPLCLLVGPPEDDAGGAQRSPSFTGSSPFIAQLPLGCEWEFAVQTGGDAELRHGETFAACSHFGRERNMRGFARLPPCALCSRSTSVCDCACLLQRRQLIRDGFVVDVNEGERSLRHLFLYTDLLLCTRFKHATRGWELWRMSITSMQLDTETTLDCRLLHLMLKYWKSKDG